MCQCVHDVPQPLHQDGVRKTLLQGELEDVQVSSQGVLVHGVDQSHLREDKEEDGTALSGWPVAVT